jgi:uncharacterized ParB-like nuclease family protein
MANQLNKPRTINIEVGMLRTNGGTQPRTAMNDDTINEYAEEMKSGAAFPPVEAIFDGDVYWLVDGFHRLAATRRCGYKKIKATVTNGTQRDAWLVSRGVNSKHGLRRTNADKRAAVESMLLDDECLRWTDGRIAAQCGVGQAMVSRTRSEMVASQLIIEIDERIAERNGEEYTVKTSKIGGKSKVKQVAPQTDPADLNFYQRWQEYAQRDPKSVHFATTGRGDELWLTFEGDATRVARLLGLRLQKFTMPGDAVAVRECVLLEVPSPKPAWWEGMYVALETNVNWYPETDSEMLAIAENQLTISAIGETVPLEAPEMTSGELPAVETEASDVPVLISSEGFPIPGARLIPTNGAGGEKDTSAAASESSADPVDVLVSELIDSMRAMMTRIRNAETQMQTTQQRALWRWINHSMDIVLAIVEPKFRKYQQRPVRVQAIRDDLSKVETTDALRPIRVAVDALKLGEEAVDGIVAELHAEINEVFARITATNHPEEAAA